VIEIGLFGGDFWNDDSSTLGKTPKLMKWIKGQKKDITCYCDREILSNLNNSKDKIKFAWLVESSSIISDIVKDIKNNYKIISQNYDFLISHDRSITNLAENFYYLPPHGYLIKEPKIHQKNKLISFITSNKRYCEGHNYRLSWYDRLKNDVDVFGKGINYIPQKEDGLNDYMFSIVIENSQYETYWSEKILDAFVTGTIPIYHGSPDIGNFFNLNGIIILNDSFNIKDINKDLYYSKMEYIKDNFERALKYFTIEDLIVEKFLN
jgi:hypothetical protein